MWRILQLVWVQLEPKVKTQIWIKPGISNKTNSWIKSQTRFPDFHMLLLQTGPIPRGQSLEGLDQMNLQVPP